MHNGEQQGTLGSTAYKRRVCDFQPLSSPHVRCGSEMGGSQVIGRMDR